MNENSYLNPGTIKAESDSAIGVLKNDNKSIEKIRKGLEKFASDDELTSQAFNTLKQQIMDYMVVLQAMTDANNLDLQDYSTLKNSVGDEELDGSVILRQKKDAIQARDSARTTASEYRSKARSAFWPWESSSYLSQASSYDNLADKNDEIRKKMEEKEQKYDDIDTNTSDLFSESAQFRLLAQNALADIKGAYKNGKYSPNMDAEWRNSDAYRKSYIDAVLNKDEKDITTGEYANIALMLTNSDEDDPSLLEYLLCNKNCWQFTDVDEDEIDTDAQLPSTGGFKASKKLEAIQTLLRMEINADTMATTANPDNINLRNRVCKLCQYNQIIDEISRNYDKQAWSYILNSNQETGMLDYITSDYITLKYDEDGNLVAKIKDEFGYNTLSAEKADFFSEANDKLINTEHYYINKYLGIDSSPEENEVNSLSKEAFDKIWGKLKDKAIDYIGGELLGQLVSGADFAMVPFEKFGEYVDEREKQTNIKYYEELGSLSTLTNIFQLGCGVSHYTYNGSEQVPNVIFYPQTRFDGKTTQDLVDAFNRMMKEDETYKIKIVKAKIDNNNTISDEYKVIVQGNLTMEYLLNYPNKVKDIIDILNKAKKETDYENVAIEEVMKKYID